TSSALVAPMLALLARLSALLVLLIVLGPLGSAQAPAPVALVHGDLVDGNISTVDDVDRWTFDAVAGEHFVLHVQDDDVEELLYLQLRVLDPSLNLIADVYAPLWGTVDMIAPATGTYTVLIDNDTAVSFVNGTGPYTLAFVKGDGPALDGSLPAGPALPVDYPEGEILTYGFELETGDNWWIRISPLEVPDVSMRVFDPAGNSLGFDSDSLFGEPIGLSGIASLDGEYKLAIWGQGTPAPLNVHYLRAPGETEFGLLGSGESFDEFIDNVGGDIDSFTVELEAGRTFVVNAGFGNTFYELEVFDPNGARVAGDQGSFGLHLEGTASVSGPHSVVLKNAVLDSSGGPYSIHHLSIPGSTSDGALLDGVSSPGLLLPDGLVSFAFLGQAGDAADLSMAASALALAPDPDFEVLLELYDPLGTKIASASATAQVGLQATLAFDGLHTVVVRDPQSLSTTPHALLVELTGSGAHPGPQLNNLLPSELLSDPVLADVGGQAGLGPVAGDLSEPFNVSLDCSSVGGPGFWVIEARSATLAAPLPTPLGTLYLDGSLVLTASGLHAADVVEAFPSPDGLSVPATTNLVGIRFTVQGYASANGAFGRLSNAIEQTIGG
ncbi:MAG: hypothetical protein AAFZ65_15640, partial [Planctomycetota bacterium]